MLDQPSHQIAIERYPSEIFGKNYSFLSHVGAFHDHIVLESFMFWKLFRWCLIILSTFCIRLKVFVSFVDVANATSVDISDTYTFFLALLDYSVGQFYDDGRQATKDILNRGRLPIVTGGTGLYLRWYVSICILVCCPFV